MEEEKSVTSAIKVLGKQKKKHSKFAYGQLFLTVSHLLGINFAFWL